VADDHHHQDVARDLHHLLREDRVNRCIVVTGASKGIGLTSAEILNARDWSVIGVVRHQPHSFPAIFINVDLVDPEATRRLGEDIPARKAALESLTRTMAVELAGAGITANAVAPGPTETELFRANNPRGSSGEARYLAQIPAGRFGKPYEVAAAIAFLASDEAGFISGQTLGVDGGASLGRM
jgi:NAD(P)-dependent dehydrogenase (short-subunit alcohol dehydrogenase family)